jgi:hypothetical protein
MSHSPGATPPPGSAGEATEPAEVAAAQPTSPEHPHNFAAQKEVHRQIRNDPDYDDWEYGTEPLPQEAWRVAAPPPADPA